MYLAYSAAGGLSRILQGSVAGGVQAAPFLSSPSLPNWPKEGLRHGREPALSRKEKRCERIVPRRGAVGTSPSVDALSQGGHKVRPYGAIFHVFKGLAFPGLFP